MERKEYVEGLIAKARAAQKEFEKNFTTQRKVDEVVRAIGLAGVSHKEELAKDALEETNMGTYEMKMSKITSTALKQWNVMRGHQAMGYIPNPHDEPGVRVIAKPIGVVGMVCPATNPVAVLLGKAMMAVKCRNAAIVAPHPRAKNVSLKTVTYIQDAIEKLGAPRNLVQVIEPEWCVVETSGELLAQTDVNIATGGPGMVRAIYSSGTPGFGVGQGNTQDIICEDYDRMDYACEEMVFNRSYDRGVLCTGDQMIHIPADKEEIFLAGMEKAGAYVIRDEETIENLRHVIFPDGTTVSRAVVGNSPQNVAKMVGLDIPEDTKVLLAKVTGNAENDVLCKEILFPFSRYRVYEDFQEAVDTAVKNLMVEGKGHNSAVWTNNATYLNYAANRLPVSRLMWNQAPFGFHAGMPHTTSFGCGYWQGNSISENLEWYHLYQTTRVAESLLNLRQARESDWDSFDICPMLEEAE